MPEAIYAEGVAQQSPGSLVFERTLWKWQIDSSTL